MIIVGVDPGSRKTGYCILKKEGSAISLISSGVLKPKGDYSSRLVSIYRSFSEILDSFKPDEFAVEGIFHGKSFKSALRLGEIRGVMILAASERDIEVFEYSPADIKSSIVGYGNATKEQVRFMVSQILNINDEIPVDESDAIAVALCHIMRRGN